MTNKNVLISGASGLIGSRVLSYLLEKTDWTVCALVSPHSDYEALLIPANYANRVTLVNHDLTNPIPELGQYDFIVHLASLSSVPDSIKDPAPFILNNVQVTLNMLEYARKYPPEMFINFSTTGIYSSQTNPTEILKDLRSNWGSILPTSPYIASKLAQEAIAYSYFHTYKLPVVIVSSSNAIGPNQAKNNFVPKIIKAIQSDIEIPIYTSNGEVGSRVYNPVANIADALLFILKNVAANIDNDRPDTFSLSGGEQLNNLEMAQTIASLLGKPLKYKLMEANIVRPGYDTHYDYSDAKLEELGWKPVQNLRDGLKDIIEGLK